jgi:hypothetical protein
MKGLFLTIATLLFSLAGFACNTCNSKQAADVRALVFGDDFYVNVFYSVLPFVVFAGIVTWISKSGKRNLSDNKVV